MKISVKVKPQAKEDKIAKVGESEYVVWVKAKAQDGKANCAVREMLSEYFDIAQSKVVLLKGERSKDKVFEIYSK